MSYDDELNKIKLDKLNIIELPKPNTLKIKLYYAFMTFVSVCCLMYARLSLTATQGDALVIRSLISAVSILGLGFSLSALLIIITTDNMN